MSWENSAAGYARAIDLNVPTSIGRTPYSPSGTIPSYSHTGPQSIYAPASPEYSHQSVIPPSAGDGSSPTGVQSSNKAFACPFCLEVGIADGASRIGDLRRHFRTKHNTNKQWHCNTGGCQAVFDWQSAYETHLKKAHPDADKSLVLSSSEAMVPCSTQVVFACGFDTCRKVFETLPDGNALATAKNYFHHVANHFRDGITTEEWYYTRRIRNLLHQTRIHDTWKALKPRYGSPPLRWQPHNSTVLKKKLEYRDLEDIKAVVDLAVMLGSHPFNSPDSPQPNLPTDFSGAPPLDPMAHNWPPRHTPSVKSEHSGTPKSHSSIHGTPTPPVWPGPRHIPSPMDVGGSGAVGPTSSSHHPMAYRPQAQNPGQVNPAAAAAAAAAAAVAQAAPFGWTPHPMYRFPGMETMGQFSTAADVIGGIDHEAEGGGGGGGGGAYPGHHHQPHRNNR